VAVLTRVIGNSVKGGERWTLEEGGDDGEGEKRSGGGGGGGGGRKGHGGHDGRKGKWRGMGEGAYAVFPLSQPNRKTTPT
jgi:hypothetical protein